MPRGPQNDGVTEIESGSLYLFYRPRVGVEDPQSADDIQHIQLILAPERGGAFRSLVVGGRALPDLNWPGRSRVWAFVKQTEADPKPIARGLGEERYRTKTRGERRRPAARPAGEGVYELIRHRDHAHLAYALELPEGPGAVQRELGIEAEASYIVSIRNPDAPAPPSAGLPRHDRAEFPADLRARFRGRKFAQLDSADFLDYEGAEIVLTAATEEASAELGVDFDPEDENAQSAEIFRDLKLKKSAHPTAPLFEGAWE